MINLYELQAKYCKIIYISRKVLKVIEREGIYWLDLALQDYLKGIQIEKRFHIKKVGEKIMITLREEE